MKNLLEGMVIAFAMYSKIPMPRVEWKKENMRYAMCFFPLVGAVIGVLVSLWKGMQEQFAFGTLLFACIGAVIPVLVTGGIHLDGFLDTVDALSAYASREKRLEILKDPHTGAFAIIFCGVYFVTTVGIYSDLSREGIWMVGLGFVFSRILSGISVAWFPCAKNSGLAATFAAQADKKRVRIVLAVEAVCVWIGMLARSPVKGIVMAGTGLAVWLYYRQMSQKKFGGITGDLAGWFLCMAELFMAVSVWVMEGIFLW